MKRTTILMIIFAFFASLGVLSAQTESVNSKLNQNYKGIGFEALDCDKSIGLKVNNSNYLLLDSIVRDCKQKIKVKSSYTNDEAIEILATIGNVLKQYNIQYGLEEKFSSALEKRMVKCDFSTFIYLTVGENISLPLFSMDAPNHRFVFWKDNDNEIYWESTTHFKSSRQYYTNII